MISSKKKTQASQCPSYCFFFKEHLEANFRFCAAWVVDWGVLAHSQWWQFLPSEPLWLWCLSHSYQMSYISTCFVKFGSLLAFSIPGIGLVHYLFPCLQFDLGRLCLAFTHLPGWLGIFLCCACLQERWDRVWWLHLSEGEQEVGDCC
jgi:hypothetical protein